MSIENEQKGGGKEEEASTDCLRHLQVKIISLLIKLPLDK